MIRLLLLRHGKSSWPSGVLDVDRPLSARGRKAAVLMGDYLSDEELTPELVLVSPARRTKETWSLVQPALGAVTTRVEPRIYDAPAARLLSMLQEIEPLTGSVLVIGHNPGFEDLARLLASHGDGEALSRLRQKYPTAGSRGDRLRLRRLVCHQTPRRQARPLRHAQASSVPARTISAPLRHEPYRPTIVVPESRSTMCA